MDEIAVNKVSGHQNEDPTEVTMAVAGTTYGDTFCNPETRMAAWVGCTLSVF